MNLKEIEEKILSGGRISREEALWLEGNVDTDTLCDAADRLRRRFHSDDVDSCSIVNARSGNCGEDCKWCAQSSRHATGCETYNFLDEEEVMTAAKRNEHEGIHRFSLVTSGRAVSRKDLEKFCEIYRHLSSETNLYLCASTGLLDAARKKMLAKAGGKRYPRHMEQCAPPFPPPCTKARPRRTPFNISPASSVTSAFGYFSTSAFKAFLNPSASPACTYDNASKNMNLGINVANGSFSLTYRKLLRPYAVSLSR